MCDKACASIAQIGQGAKPSLSEQSRQQFVHNIFINRLAFGDPAQADKTGLDDVRDGNSQMDQGSAPFHGAAVDGIFP